MPSPYLTNPPLTTREKRTLAVLRELYDAHNDEALDDPDDGEYMTALDRTCKADAAACAMIAELENAGQEPAPVDDPTHPHFLTTIKGD